MFTAVHAPASTQRGTQHRYAGFIASDLRDVLRELGPL
jgi:hypothetical protein